MRRLTLPLGALLLVAPLLLPVQGLADEFVWAFHDYSPDLDPVRLDATTEIGVTTWSQRLRWRQIEPDLPEAGPSTVAEVTDAAVEAYASDESLDWAPYDTKLTALVGAGYDLVLEVGLGGYSCSPTWLGETATPDVTVQPPC